MKKLESLEIFYVSDESEQSSFVDKNEICSASSVASTSTRTENKEVNPDPNLKIQNFQESVDNPPKSSIASSRDMVQIVLQISTSSAQSHYSPAAGEEEINSYPEPTAQKFETQELKEETFSPWKSHTSSVEEAHTTNNDRYLKPPS